jgi:hypothetical protein
MRLARGWLPWALLPALIAAGCAPDAHSAAESAAFKLSAAYHPVMPGLSTRMAVLDALCDPPLGWRPDPIKHNADHDHQVWRSPTGDTAYGVIRFSMPLPLGPGFALAGFLSAMKRTEGEANLLNREDDPNLPGIRFVAEGGRYKLYTILIVDGFSGWAVYAGTLRNRAENQPELDAAKFARDHTVLGLPLPGHAP